MNPTNFYDHESNQFLSFIMRQNNVMVSVSIVQGRPQNSTVHKPGCRHSDSEYCQRP
jgi:hypothetical protein